MSYSFTGDLALVVLVVIVVIALSCSGGSRSPEPQTHLIETGYGSATVRDECGSVDLGEIRSEILQAYNVGAKQRIGVRNLSLDGTIITMTPDIHPSRIAQHNFRANGVSMVRARCGREDAVSHEMFHRFAHQLHLPCDRALVGHPGGWNLRCERLNKE